MQHLIISTLYTSVTGILNFFTEKVRKPVQIFENNTSINLVEHDILRHVLSLKALRSKRISDDTQK